MKNKNTKNFAKKGFTLIELLAVIIILGILATLAIPAVTKYINNSRKTSYITSAKNIVRGATALANSESLDMNKMDTTYYIPAKYIKTEEELKSPYGEFTEAYVGVIYEGKNYRYFWASNDSSGQGIKIVTEKDKLDIDQIEGNTIDIEIRDAVEKTGIEDRKKILILNLDGTWQEEREAIYNVNRDGEFEPADTMTAIFSPGVDFNIRIKQLAGDIEPSYNTINTNIIHVKRSKDEPDESNKQEQNIVSTADSEVPIYAWFIDGTLYWWSEDIKPNLNSDATKMFAYLQGAEDIELKYIKTNLTRDMPALFQNCFNIESLDLRNFDTSNVENMQGLFYGMTKIKSLDLSNFNTKNTINMYALFYMTESLESLNISNFDTSNVKRMDYMFFKAKKLKRLDLRNFNTSNVENMQGMFQIMSSLESLNISSFDTSKVNTFRLMFSESKSLKKVDLSNFDTSSATSMQAMFQIAESLEEIDVSGFDTSKVTDMSYMFGCGSSTANCKLNNIKGLEKLDTGNVTNMKYMFVNQQELRTLDLSSFNTSKTTDMSGMFLATNLTTIYASQKFNVSNVGTSTNMFAKSGSGISAPTAYVLTGGAGTTYDANHKDKEYARIDDPANGMPGYFTLKAN